MKYFSPIKCHKLIYLLTYVDFHTCSGRWHFQLASHIADRTTHKPIKIHLIKNLKAKRRQPIGCDIAFRQIENMAQSLTYVFVKICYKHYADCLEGDFIVVTKCTNFLEKFPLDSGGKRYPNVQSKFGKIFSIF